MHAVQTKRFLVPLATCHKKGKLHHMPFALLYLQWMEDGSPTAYGSALPLVMNILALGQRIAWAPSLCIPGRSVVDSG
jgi:hypothetical protein